MYLRLKFMLNWIEWYAIWTTIHSSWRALRVWKSKNFPSSRSQLIKILVSKSIQMRCLCDLTQFTCVLAQIINTMHSHIIKVISQSINFVNVVQYSHRPMWLIPQCTQASGRVWWYMTSLMVMLVDVKVREAQRGLQVQAQLENCLDESWRGLVRRRTGQNFGPRSFHFWHWDYWKWWKCAWN